MHAQQCRPAAWCSSPLLVDLAPTAIACTPACAVPVSVTTAGATFSFTLTGATVSGGAATVAFAFAGISAPVLYDGRLLRPSAEL